MKVALAVYGTRGDIQPTLALGRALRARGCDLLLCATPEFADAAAAAGAEFVPVGNDVKRFLQRHTHKLGGGMLSSMATLRSFFAEEVGSQFAELTTGAAGCDLIIGAGLQLAAGSVAEHYGIPYRFLAFTPTMVASYAHAPPAVPEWLPSSTDFWRSQVTVRS